jgi:two-component system, OmpR family, response regulator
MRALQRRPSAVQQPEIVIGDLRFDPVTRQVLVGGRLAVLTATEFGILELLVRKSPAVVPRRSIALNVWEDETDAMGSNTIDVHLARLRAKLAGGRVRIETVRSIGYRLVSQ